MRFFRRKRPTKSESQGWVCSSCSAVFPADDDWLWREITPFEQATLDELAKNKVVL